MTDNPDDEPADATGTPPFTPEQLVWIDWFIVSQQDQRGSERTEARQ